MKSHEDRLEVGVFENHSDAERAVERLHQLGYERDDISVMMTDKTRARTFATETGSKAAEGATSGGVIGGAIGAIVAGVTATGSIAAVVGTGGAALPLVAGPLAAVLAGLGAGGLAGGIIGALIGAGIPEERAREYEAGLTRGGILIAVTPRAGDRAQVEEILRSTPSSSSRTGEIAPEQSYAPRNTIH